MRSVHGSFAASHRTHFTLRNGESASSALARFARCASSGDGYQVEYPDRGCQQRENFGSTISAGEPPARVRVAKTRRRHRCDAGRRRQGSQRGDLNPCIGRAQKQDAVDRERQRRTSPRKRRPLACRTGWRYRVIHRNARDSAATSDPMPRMTVSASGIHEVGNGSSARIAACTIRHRKKPASSVPRPPRTSRMPTTSRPR